MKQTFELTITNQKRVLTALLLFPFVIFGVLFISLKFNPGFGFLSFLLLAFLIYYFVIGKLNISIEDDKIYFEWKKKLFFNYNDIQNLNEADIEKIIVDNGQFLRKIVAKDRVINLSTSKIKPTDAYRLITYFNQKSKLQNFEVKDSWENINPRRLKIIYAITWIIIIASLLILILVSVFKGFKPNMFFIIGIIPMLFVYLQRIKNAIEKNKSNSN